MKSQLRSFTYMATALLITAAVAQKTAVTPARLKGKPLPPISMKLLAGGFATNGSLKGKVVILDFWASWCGPCKAASPTMQALYAKYKAKGLIVIGANTLEEKAGPSFAAEYRKGHGYTYPFTYDNQKLTDSWGMTGVPVFVFVDRKGVVREVVQKFKESEQKPQFQALVAKLLAEK